MHELLQLRIGGGRVRPGLLPAAAGRLVEDLVSALGDFGGDPELWANANAHISIVGKGSTVATLWSDFATSLRPAVVAFRGRAERVALDGKAFLFVDRNFKPSAPWTYAELMPDNGSPAALRFDYDYRQRLRKRILPVEVVGEDSFYGRVVRVGGDSPPTAKVELLGHGSRTLDICGKRARNVAKALGAKLYETVLLRGVAKWDADTLKLIDFAIHDVDLTWEDASLTSVIEENGGVLPISLTVEDEEEIRREREAWRGEPS